MLELPVNGTEANACLLFFFALSYVNFGAK